MQADYTRKTQAVAPWRGLAEELGVDDPEAIRQAAEFYTYLQDPNNLRTFHQQLSAALGAPAAGPAAPATHPGMVNEPEFDDLESDPDPEIAELRREIQAMRQESQTRAAQERAEQEQWALIGEINRQDAMLREDPQWSAADEQQWEALYTLAPAFGGDLFQTAQALDDFATARLSAFLQGKTAVEATEGVQPIAPPRTAEIPREIDGEDDPELKNAHREALGFLRGMFNGSE